MVPEQNDESCPLAKLLHWIGEAHQWSTATEGERKKKVKMGKRSQKEGE